MELGPGNEVLETICCQNGNKGWELKNLTFFASSLTQLKGDQKKGYLFFGSFFRQTSFANFSETVYPNDLKFKLERNPI